MSISRSLAALHAEVQQVFLRGRRASKRDMLLRKGAVAGIMVLLMQARWQSGV